MSHHLRGVCFLFSRIVCSKHSGVQQHVRPMMTTTILTNKRQDRQRAKVTEILVLDSHFDQTTKNKETFLEKVEAFKKTNPKTGIVEFIYVALKRMQQYGVHEDLEVYKTLIDLMPKGKMIPSNFILADSIYYPKHQRCITMVLLQMEENRVYPDRKLYDLLLSIFGKLSMPTSKYLRMQYWLPKFKHINPWPYPREGVPDKVEAAKKAMKIMSDPDIESEITVFQTRDDPSCREDTWIVSCQSPIQRKLIYYHPKNIPIYVEGPYWQYMGRKDRAQYFVLRSELPKNRRRKPIKDPDDVRNLKASFFDPPTPEDLIPDFSVHEQSDGIIFGMCIPGSTNRQCLMSWIRYLESHGNSRLEEMTILFRNSLPLDEEGREEEPSNENDIKLLEESEKNTS